MGSKGRVPKSRLERPLYGRPRPFSNHNPYTHFIFQMSPLFFDRFRSMPSKFVHMHHVGVGKATSTTYDREQKGKEGMGRRNGIGRGVGKGNAGLQAFPNPTFSKKWVKRAIPPKAVSNFSASSIRTSFPPKTGVTFFCTVPPRLWT